MTVVIFTLIFIHSRHIESRMSKRYKMYAFKNFHSFNRLVFKEPFKKYFPLSVLLNHQVYWS